MCTTLVIIVLPALLVTRGASVTKKDLMNHHHHHQQDERYMYLLSEDSTDQISFFSAANCEEWILILAVLPLKEISSALWSQS